MRLYCIEHGPFDQNGGRDVQVDHSHNWSESHELKAYNSGKHKGLTLSSSAPCGERSRVFSGRERM